MVDFEASAHSRVPLSPILELTRVRVRRADLHAADGGREALLLPAYEDRFEIAVDPTPPGGWEGRDDAMRHAISHARTRFRVAHEVGHTFFYERHGERPRRLFPPGSKEEESFCDAFAEELLVPDPAILQKPPEAAHIFDVASGLGVSVEVVVRAVARRHPSRPKVSLFYWPQRLLDAAQATLQWTNSCLTSPPAVWESDAFDYQRKQLIFVET